MGEERRYRRLEDMLELVIDLTKNCNDLKELRSHLHSILWALKDEKLEYLKEQYGVNL